MQQRAFVDRFLERLDKIDPSEVESFILRTVAQRDFYARLLETLTEGVIILDEEFRVSLVNLAARRILRWPLRRRVVGEPLLGLLEDGPLRRLTERFVRDPHPVENEEMVLHPQSKRIHNVHILPIVQPGGDEAERGAAIILQDLTPARERQARSADAQRVASLLTLTAGVAHEIKNPLNSLSIHAQLLERAVGDLNDPSKTGASGAAERIVRSCRAIQEEIERLRACVDDFIEAARPRKPNLVLRSLNRIVEEAARRAALECEERSIRVQTELDAEIPPVALDQEQMLQALGNLLRNAMEAIEEAKRPPEDRRITLRTVGGDELVSLEVSDNGIGIRDSDLPRIFEPYFTTKFRGSGLGLMAVARIVRDHGGLVTVRSEQGEGTTFTIDLPIPAPRVKLLEGKGRPGRARDEGQTEMPAG